MPLNEREESVLAGIQEWENKLLSYEPNDLEMVYDKSLEGSFSLLPEEVQQQFFRQWIAGCFIFMRLFRVHSFKWMRKSEF